MHICHHGGFLEHQPSFTEWWMAHSRLPLTSRTPHSARSNSWGWGLAVGTPLLSQGHGKECIAGDWCYWVVAGSSFIYPFYLMFTHLRFMLVSTLSLLTSPSITFLLRPPQFPVNTYFQLANRLLSTIVCASITRSSNSSRCSSLHSAPTLPILQHWMSKPTTSSTSHHMRFSIIKTLLNWTSTMSWEMTMFSWLETWN